MFHHIPGEKEALRKLFMPDDEPWNAAGHVIAARAIAETLKSEGLIEQEFFRQAFLSPNGRLTFFSGEPPPVEWKLK